jgi:hypothetical protein
VHHGPGPVLHQRTSHSLGAHSIDVVGRVSAPARCTRSEYASVRYPSVPGRKEKSRDRINNL